VSYEIFEQKSVKTPEGQHQKEHGGARYVQRQMRVMRGGPSCAGIDKEKMTGDGQRPGTSKLRAMEEQL